MSDLPHDLTANRAVIGPPGRPRRGARLTTVAAVLALAVAIYALVRIDATRDRLDGARDTLRAVQASQEGLRAEFTGLTDRNERARQDLAAQLETLKQVPQQVAELNATLEEVRGRTEGSTRAWARTEALFLLELAQQRLAFARDVGTASAALQAADARLASLHDASVTDVRREIAAEIESLRAVAKLDLPALMARLATAETRAAQLKLRGLQQGQHSSENAAPLPARGFGRARAMLDRTLSNLLTVRRVDSGASEIVTLEEQELRRQHLQMLLFSARQAVLRGDAAAYRDNVQRAREWLERYFEADDESVRGLHNDLGLLVKLNISPVLPDISASALLLQRTGPAARSSS